MGLTQHRNGVAVIQEVANLILMGGHIGKKGAGLCPVQGHSNVRRQNCWNLGKAE